MYKLLLVFSLTFLTTLDVSAQEISTKCSFMQITTIESIIGGGSGRSRMLITKEDGSQEEREMENLFSIAGINFKNIKTNESSILTTLKSFTDEGWKLVYTVPLTVSPTQGGAGIFMTRYLLSREEGKK